MKRDSSHVTTIVSHLLRYFKLNLPPTIVSHLLRYFKSNLCLLQFSFLVGCFVRAFKIKVIINTKMDQNGTSKAPLFQAIPGLNRRLDIKRRN